jgi:hypothetical protein
MSEVSSFLSGPVIRAVPFFASLSAAAGRPGPCAHRSGPCGASLPLLRSGGRARTSEDLNRRDSGAIARICNAAWRVPALKTNKYSSSATGVQQTGQRGRASRRRRQPGWADEPGKAMFGAQAPNRSRGARPGPRHLAGVNQTKAAHSDSGESREGPGRHQQKQQLS